MSACARPDFNVFHKDHPDPVLTLPGDVCSLLYRGSIAHNMYVPSNDPNSIDDVDMIGVAIAPLNCYFGLKEWGSRGTKEIKQGRYDVVIYEIRKAASLLLQGNPNILSMLWTKREHILYELPEAKVLRDNRNLFVGKHVYASFAGYASAQLQKMETRDSEELLEYLHLTAEANRRGIHPNHKGDSIEPEEEIPAQYKQWGDGVLLQRLASYTKKGENIGYLGDKRKRLVLQHGYDSKNAAHCIRLLRMCKEFLSSGELQVYRESDREELLEIKRGKWPLTDVKALAEQLFSEIKVERDRSPLPSEPDRDAVEAVVMTSVERFHYATVARRPA